MENNVVENIEYGVVFANFLSSVLLPVISAFVLALTGIGITKFNKWINTKTDVEIDFKLNELAESAVRFAEELALKRVKGAKKFTGKSKLDSAIVFMMSNCPEVSKDYAEALIHSALNKIGLGASGK